MSRFHRIALLAGLILGPICSPFQQALAQAAGGAARPPAFDPSSATSIAAFINGQIGVMTTKGATPQAQESARDAIADTPRPTPAPGGAEPTPVSYAALYATALNNAAVAILKDTEVDIRARLNLAIAIARVAEHTRSANLAPAVQALMNDKHPALQLWGLKGVRPMLPALLATGAAGPLINQVQAVARQHPKDTAIAQEAYEAFSVAPGGLNPTIIKPVIGPLLALAQARVAQYENGAASPPDPAIEVTAINYLMKPGLWTLLAPQDQQAVMQLICDLMSHVATRSAVDEAQYDQYKQLVASCAGGIWVVATILKDQNLIQVAATARGAAEGAGKPDLRVLVKPLLPAIRAVPQFANIKVPVGNGAGNGGPVAADAKPPAD
jgi:hypothetical protein